MPIKCKPCGKENAWPRNEHKTFACHHLDQDNLQPKWFKSFLFKLEQDQHLWCGRANGIMVDTAASAATAFGCIAFITIKLSVSCIKRSSLIPYSPAFDLGWRAWSVPDGYCTVLRLVQWHLWYEACCKGVLYGTCWLFAIPTDVSCSTLYHDGAITDIPILYSNLLPCLGPAKGRFEAKRIDVERKHYVIT